MIVRALDKDGDWTFGQGLSNYLVNIDALAQVIQTRIKSYLANCFFDLGAGIPWDQRLSQKGTEELLKSDVYNIIINTDGVLGITSHEINVVNRRAYIRSIVESIYGQLIVEVNNG